MLTDTEFQDRWQISITGRRYTRRTRTASGRTDRLPGEASSAWRRTALALLDDEGFMRSRRGMVPAAVANDAWDAAAGSDVVCEDFARRAEAVGFAMHAESQP